ncbi:glycosyltransferase [Vagococcus lutrae]|uniref:glycosyltransferase n=1 Tax=Vagococcus lutrae TaxID=81947 RepID=UPI001C94B2DD|nr:glycosyltransferase [Vagococcus lutrae]QZN89576.1 glycosyltransferase [Vagococcus lutrae]
MGNKKYPIRVLHVVGIMNYGGAETLIMNWYRNIDRSKYQFDFLVHFSEKGKFDDEIKQLGGNIYYIPRYKGINHLEYISSFKKHLNNHIEHQIIHFHIRSTAKFLSKEAKKLSRKTILHSHSISERKGLSSVVKKITKLNINKNIDLKLACSKEAGKWLFGEEKFSIIPNAIPIRNYKVDSVTRERLRKEINCENKRIIGHVGRFTYEKNHEYLLKIMEHVKDYDDLVLVLIGEGPLFKEIKIKSQGLNVILLGAQSNINEWLMAMDLFVFPSLYEGLGIAVVEAQASGLPVICSDRVPNESKLISTVRYQNLEEMNKWLEYVIKIPVNTLDERVRINKELCYSSYNIETNIEVIQEAYQQFL